ncbi:MAG: MFS transporter [Polaromonas sp.]
MTPSTPNTHKVGITLAVIQLFFTLTWTVYVIFLPQLAAKVGLAKGMVLVILMMDQLIFLVADTVMGVFADKSARVFGKLGRWVVLLTLASCAAFLLLPWVASTGPEAQWLFLALTVVWSVTSSALRAPPLVLLGKYASLASIPRLASVSLVGLGMAGAMAPYLTVALRGLDPRWPFALSSMALALATFGILWAERSLKSSSAPAPAALADAASRPPMLPFLAAMVLLGLGFQIHSSLNSAPQYLRFAKPAELEFLLPVFWIGFSLLMLAASRLTARYGGLLVMGIAGCGGALATYAATAASTLELLVAAQFLAGGAWGVLMMSAFTSALVIGRTGREGLVTGAMFSLLALAAFVRIALVSSQLNKDAQFAPLLPWLPPVTWALAALVLLVMAWQLRAAHAVASGTAV